MRALTQQELSNLEQMQAQPAGRRAWLGVGGKLYLAFGAIAAATVIAGVLAMVAFEEAQQALVRLSDRSIPVISESLALSRDGTAIVAAAPALAAVRTEAERAAARARLDRLIGQVGERLGTLEAMQADGIGRAAEVVRKFGTAIVSLDQAVGRRLSLAAARERIIVDASTAHTGLLNLLVPMVDDANFELVMASETAMKNNKSGVTKLMEGEVNILRAGLETLAAGQELNAIIAESAVASEETALVPMAERFLAAAGRVRGGTDSLPEGKAFDTARAVSALLIDTGLGSGNVFDLRRSELNIDKLEPHQREAVRAQRSAIAGDIQDIMKSFNATTAAIVDAANFDLVIGGETIAEETSKTVSTLIGVDVDRLRRLLDVMAQANLVIGLVRAAGNEPNAEGLQPIRDRLAASRTRIDESMAALKGAKIEEIGRLADALLTALRAEGGILSARADELAAEQDTREALDRTRADADTLTAAVAETVSAARVQGADVSAAAAGTIARNRTMLGATAAVSVLMALAIGWLLVGRGVVRQLVGLEQAMGRLTAGDLDSPIPAARSNDELGRMSRAVAVFKQNAETMRRMEHEKIESERAAAQERQDAMNALADGFDASVRGVVDSLAEAAERMRTTALDMSSAAEQTSQQATSAAAAALEATTNVNAVSEAAEHLSTAVGGIGGQVADASRTAERAVEEATRTDRTVQSLSEAAEKIGAVVDLISEIAGQTNLLALNATIEAARAGDAGRGFAVVAEEVKRLAAQTASATEDIRRQVDGIRGVSGDAIGAIQGIAKTIGELHRVNRAVVAAVDEQIGRIHEISANAQGAAEGTGAVSENIEEVSGASQRTGESSGAVLREAGTLAESSKDLRRVVDGFLAKVRG